MRPTVLRAGLAVAALAAAPLLGACGADTAPRAASAPPSSSPTQEGQGSGSTNASRTAASESPSLPPGDPGVDAPSVPDPGTSGPPAHGGDSPLRQVPKAAMFSTTDLARMAGGSWRASAAEPASCTELPDAVAVRVTGYADARGGGVLQAVTTHRDASAADQAVGSLRSVLDECGWATGRDPRLGSASVAATRGSGAKTERLTAVSVDGVGLVLVGRGAVTTPAWQWDGLVDLAQGSVCPAAPDGCH